MAIDFDLFVYAAPPRMATTWIRHAAVTADLRENERTKVHWPFDENETRLKVSTVRHPVEWLRSYYSAIYPGSIGIAEVDIFSRYRGVQSLNEFVRAYLRLCDESGKGLIGAMVDSYQADIVLKVEDLPYAFVMLLESIGVPSVMANRCRSIGRKAASKSNREPLSRALYDRVMATEYDYVQRFDY